MRTYVQERLKKDREVAEWIPSTIVSGMQVRACVRACEHVRVRVCARVRACVDVYGFVCGCGVSARHRKTGRACSDRSWAGMSGRDGATVLLGVE